MSERENYKSEHKFAGEEPARGPGAEEEDKDSMTAGLGIPVSDQRPVSVVGWALALVAGASLWVALFMWFAG